MARPATKKPSSDSATPAASANKARSARTLLMAAALLAVASLGGGFVLARIAFKQDAAAYEPAYVAEETADAQAAAAAPQGEAATEEAGGHGEADAAAVGVEGILEFEEIVTNINSFDARGTPIKAFLKLTLVLVYRPDPGAAELMRARQPFMRDLFTGYARSLNETDVRGMAGVLNVKAELLKRARAAAGSDLPQEILISDLVVQ